MPLSAQKQEEEIETGKVAGSSKEMIVCLDEPEQLSSWARQLVHMYKRTNWILELSISADDTSSIRDIYYRLGNDPIPASYKQRDEYQCDHCLQTITVGTYFLLWRQLPSK